MSSHRDHLDIFLARQVLCDRQTRTRGTAASYAETLLEDLPSCRDAISHKQRSKGLKVLNFFNAKTLTQVVVTSCAKPVPLAKMIPS
ncbi:hypothetical protein MAR_028837 [Mya arenaria]|uniref:Uncharacterized protein n=1 Tax=Mya arenaria TaxID=6604 RepID=A0ABY7DER5_MYAAR|nr:hypothetical protein MAR_028837 [Mya arenaria]